MKKPDETMKTAKLLIMIAALLMLSSLLSSSASALGVGPSRQYVSFEPGQTFKGQLMIINDGGQDFKAALYAQGDMAEYVKIDRPLIDISAGETTKQAEYEIQFPSETIKPGEHKLELVIRQFPADSKATEGTVVSASMAVISQVIIKAPYPGKYAEGKLYITGAEQNGTPAKFAVALYNFGTDDIQSAYAKIEVFGPTWEKLAEFKTDAVPVKSKQETVLQTMWQPNVNKGTYHATVTVYYDDKEFKLEQNFDVGKFTIDVSDISVKNFRLGDVAKFDILLYNSWNTQIDNVYVEMSIDSKEGKRMTEFKTGVISIPAEKEGKLEAYWYTEGVAPGIYDVKLLVHYGSKIVQKEYEFEVSTNSITKLGAVGGAVTLQEQEEATGRGTLILLIILTLVLLIGMNIMWFYKLNKMMKGNKGEGGSQ